MSARRLLLGLLLPALVLVAASARGEALLPPDWRELVAEAAPLADPGERAARISEKFLGVPYQANTLNGGPGTAEKLTVELAAVDCFTLLDYVEALRRSTSPDEFSSRLVEVRYRDGLIAWDRRRHFFTDWATAPGGRIVDVTAALDGNRVQQVFKQLNRKADGTLFLRGVPVQARTVSYLPPAAFNDRLFQQLRPGDYLGIYTPAAGLDVSHVGIVVRRDDRLWLRHASARRALGRVVDSPLRDYLADKPGLVVLRPR